MNNLKNVSLQGNIVTTIATITYDMVTKYIPTPRFITGEGKEGYNT